MFFRCRLLERDMTSDSLTTATALDRALIKRAQRAILMRSRFIFIPQMRIYALCFRMTNMQRKRQDLAQGRFPCRYSASLTTSAEIHTFATWRYSQSGEPVVMHFRRKAQRAFHWGRALSSRKERQAGPREYGDQGRASGNFRHNASGL